jgi:hypothetical protein
MNVSFKKPINTLINKEFIFGWFDNGCNIKCNKCEKILNNEYGILKRTTSDKVYYLDDDEYNPINQITCYSCAISFKLFTKLNCFAFNSI